MIIPYREINHGSFSEEWSPHLNANDWWYITGYIQDENNPGHLYSYQFTVFNPTLLKKTIFVLHLAFSDMQTGEHLFEHKLQLPGKKTHISQDSVTFLPFALLQKSQNEMTLTAATQKLGLNLKLNMGKGAVWHCDNGVLAMGLPDDPFQRTVYYSYTNMPTSGNVEWRDSSGQKREMTVIGKSWFDRQWGPFRLLDTASFWEWFSIRFFDDEEVMLFAFPQHGYYDGTYINKDGKNQRVKNYEYTYHTLKKRGKLIFPFGWDITIPGIKEERYQILPMNDKQYNSGYYEMMARVTRSDGTEVGYCFVELLPGTRQEPKRFNLLDLALSR
jgi:predicted secreted hydrolase